MSTIFDRQNDQTAITYLRASMYCNKQKLKITYYMIVVSLLVTLASIGLRIAVRYYPQIPEIYSQAVVLISGLVLISNIFCAIMEYDYNIMSVNLLERYDIYVFGIPANKALMRPIPEQKIILYARKYNPKKVARLRNYYFKTPEEAETKNSNFLNIKKSFEYSHRLLLSVYGFFAFLWVGYGVLVFMIAVFLSARDTFLSTLINIFVPALSTISLIASAWRRFNEQSRRLSNAINVTSELSASASGKDATVNLQSRHVIRGLQDVRFNLRANDFTIPLIMVKRFNSKLRAEQELAKSDASFQATLTNKPQIKRASGLLKSDNYEERQNNAENAEGARSASPKTTGALVDSGDHSSRAAASADKATVKRKKLATQSPVSSVDNSEATRERASTRTKTSTKSQPSEASSARSGSNNSQTQPPEAKKATTRTTKK